MQLKEKGRYFELPVAGLKIASIIYTGLLRLVLNDANNSFIDLHGDFEIIRHNQKNILSPRSKDALMLFYDLFGVMIKDAKADKYGGLFITFENGFELTVDDGPFENWHFTSINALNPKKSIYFHGGVGKTVC
jgi:hypothetical protein